MLPCATACYWEFELGSDDEQNLAGSGNLRVMGSPMAKNILKKGHPLVVFNDTRGEWGALTAGAMGTHWNDDGCITRGH